MRTTVDLPDELLREAKVAAIERGTTLRELIGNALYNELNRQDSPQGSFRLQQPVFTSKQPGALPLESVNLATLDAEEDVRQDGLLR